MKGYGLDKKDCPMDCTSVGKFGITELPNPCSCGAKHGRPGKDHKSRKAKERRKNNMNSTIRKLTGMFEH